MKKRIERYVFYSITIAGVVFFALTIYKRIEYIIYEKKKVEFIYTNEEMHIGDILKNGCAYIKDTIDIKKRYTAIYVISSTGCSICLKQFQIINSMFSERTYNMLFNKLLVVIDSNIVRGKWFAKANPIDENAVSEISEAVKSKLVMYETEKYDRQLILIDNDKNIIFFRMKIKTGIQLTKEDINNKIKPLIEKKILL